jgi:hypothetical protein
VVEDNVEEVLWEEVVVDDVSEVVTLVLVVVV